MAKGREIVASRIKSKELQDAFFKVNREEFLPEELKKYAYDEKYIDSPLQITPEITTTALSLGIYMLDNLDLKRGQKVLEIGTGIGYYTALMAEIVDKVYSIEINDEMVGYSKKMLAKLNYVNTQVVKGDGTLGLEEEKPFDRIVVWAACPTLPCKLYDQLKEQGIMIAPIGTTKLQTLYKIIKRKDPEVQKLANVVFVKIKGVYGFYDESQTGPKST